MPLNAERKPCSIGDANGFDRAVLGHTFDHNALANVEDALSVQ
jgi:hypothetical protein